MRIGAMTADMGSLSVALEHARTLATAGYDTVWVPQLLGVDALMTAALLGRQVPGIEIGTAVVATYPRHPLVMAQQALTAQAACGGRLTLGIGVSHRFVIEGIYGGSFDRPRSHLEDYLKLLLPALRGEQHVSVADAAPPSVLVAAMGPRMLELAASAADGTITWMTGPRTLEHHVVPAITTTGPRRVVAGLPVGVTADVSAAREQVAHDFRIYGRVPSYRAMLDREGADGPADVAILGDEERVAAQVQALADIGVTDLLVAEFGDDDTRRLTRKTLGEIAR